MSNIVDRLFEDVKAQLPPDSNNIIPRWPDLPEGKQDKFDELNGDSEDGIYTYGEHEKISKTINRIGDGEEIFEPSSEDNEIIEGGIRAMGFEAIAFYKSKRMIDSLLPCTQN